MKSIFTFNSITFKFSALYILLAIINMSFFVFIIFENQVDIITDNTRYRAKTLVSSLVSSLDEVTQPDSAGKLLSPGTREESLKEIKGIVAPLASDYVIFDDRGEIIERHGNPVSYSDGFLLAGIKTLAKKEFAGENYHVEIDESSGKLNFFIPIAIPSVQAPILHFSLGTGEINRRLGELYRLAVFIIAVIALLHGFFAFLLYAMIVKPIQLLKRQSADISGGDLYARVNLKRNDEIGALSSSLNRMADNITEKIKTIEHMALTDGLTGLYNRRHLFDRLESEVSKAKRSGEGIGTMMIDIDHFKKINDGYGHQTGDHVISSVAGILVTTCRTSDIIGRYGGEEFAVITGNQSMVDVKKLAERIRKGVEKMVIAGNETLKVTVSIGISFFPPELIELVQDIEDLFHCPDQGLYRAKRKGRNRTEAYLVTRKDFRVKK